MNKTYHYEIFTSEKIRKKFVKIEKKVYLFTTKDIGFDAANQTYVNKNLTSAIRSLLHKTDMEKKQVGWKNIWTKNGKIYCKKQSCGVGGFWVESESDS